MFESETNTHLQFKHAFPRCNGARGGGLVLELSKLIARRLVQIFDRALKSWRPLSLQIIYGLCGREGSLWEGKVGGREQNSKN